MQNTCWSKVLRKTSNLVTAYLKTSLTTSVLALARQGKGVKLGLHRLFLGFLLILNFKLALQICHCHQYHNVLYS